VRWRGEGCWIIGIGQVWRFGHACTHLFWVEEALKAIGVVAAQRSWYHRRCGVAQEVSSVCLRAEIVVVVFRVTVKILCVVMSDVGRDTP
jgi:hypothetical protein